jgi:hypothetical protein
MDFATVISALLRLIGLAEWFEGFIQKRTAAKQAQDVANAPVSREELDERLQNHEF